MPCTDVTEAIRVVIDNEEQVHDYNLSKETCGLPVGDYSLILEQIKGKCVDELLQYTSESFLESFSLSEELEQFLVLKHLFAVQSALSVLTGKQPGRKEDACVAAEVSFDGDMTIIDALIKVNLITEKIQACYKCHGCPKVTN